MRRFRENWIGRVHVSTTLTWMIYRLPPVLRKLRSDHPGLDVVLTNMPTQQTVARILSNEIDLGRPRADTSQSDQAHRRSCHRARPR